MNSTSIYFQLLSVPWLKFLMFLCHAVNGNIYIHLHKPKYLHTYLYIKPHTLVLALKK